MANITVDDLKQRITIQKAVTTQDEEANVITTYQNDGERWAKVDVKNANNKSSDAEWYRQVSYRITMRKTPLQYNSRIIYCGKTLTLTAPVYDVDNAFTVANAVELAEEKNV